MNSRASVTLIIFLAWGAASTWWYTCRIKGMCAQEVVEIAPVISQAEKIIPLKKDTVAAATVTETLEKVTILFSSGSVEQEKNADIDNYIKSLAKQLMVSGKKITIVGHTDNTGDAELNLKLGMQRAESVKAQLVQLGAGRDLITCQSKGETQPVASNETEEGKRENRRVEILFN